MKFQVVLFSLGLFFSLNTLTEAQRLIERGMILNPLENSLVDLNSGDSQWFSQVGGWGSFGSYGMYGDENHEWYQHLGAYLEIYRRGSVSSLAVTGQIEFIADTNNDINFSPRAIFWEEGILYTHRVRRSFVQIGYYHRCKHDIDNFRFGEERTIVFGSGLARLVVPISLFSAEDTRIAFQYDHYTITWEKRTPDTFQNGKFDWDQLRHSFKINASLKHPLRGKANFYVDSYLMGTLLEDHSWFNGQIRAEIGSSTPAGDIRFGVHLEHLGDSGIPVHPTNATLVGIGIRIMTLGSVR